MVLSQEREWQQGISGYEARSYAQGRVFVLV